MPRISQLTTGTPNSTSDLIGNVGSTTVRFNVSLLPGSIPSTAGTSGQVLQTSAGAATWVNSTTIPGALPSTVGTSGQLLQTSGGVAAWVSITSGGVLHGNSSGEVGVLAVGTSGQRLAVTTAAPLIPAWINDLWGVTVQFNSAASSQIAMFRVPFDCVISEWDMTLSTGPTTAAGSATVEVRVNGVSSTPATSVAQISSAQPVTISNASNGGSSALSSWTSTSLSVEQWVTLYVASVSSADTISLSLGGRRR